MIDTSLTCELIHAGFRMSLAGGKLRVEPALQIVRWFAKAHFLTQA